MNDKDFVEQWVCLVREGEYETNGQKWTITKAMIDDMVEHFDAPLRVWPNEECFQLSWQHPGTTTNAAIVAVEARNDEHGRYLAGNFRTAPIAISTTTAHLRVGGASFGASMTAPMFTNAKLSPIERATDPLESSSPARTLPDSR